MKMGKPIDLGALQVSTTMEASHSPAETLAIERHRGRLGKQLARPASAEEALADWQENHAAGWRRQRQEVMMKHQREEMLRYKWLESEKASEDVGKGVFMDWIQAHAASWRKWYDRNEADILEKHNL
jgi:hypothetical protein